MTKSKHYYDYTRNCSCGGVCASSCGSGQGMSNKDKHIEDIEKAMNHLRFELERLRDEH